MTILYSETMYESLPLATFIFLSIAIFVAVIFGWLVGASNDHASAAAGFFPLWLIILFCVLMGCTCLISGPFTNKDVHYAIIDDTSLSEVLEEYNIVEQKGSLFILEEKAE